MDEMAVREIDDLIKKASSISTLIISRVLSLILGRSIKV